MGERTSISWCDHTWNPWWGCTKVGGSPACDHCYAESFANRVGYGPNPKDADKFPIWGDGAQRRYFGDKHWNEPLRWNAIAEKSGILATVFCASMSDWAEGRPEQAPHLDKLWKLQAQTHNLIWLMLTKRPQLIDKLCPPGHPIEANRWFGTTAETQKWLDIRWDHLKRVYSPVYWLSIEPLMERVVLPDDLLSLGRRAWVIVGGESGPHARPMHPDWVRSLRDQCIPAGVAFHHKQWGEWAPWREGMRDSSHGHLRESRNVNPGITMGDPALMYKIGAHNAGAVLDGREWKEFPR